MNKDENDVSEGFEKSLQALIGRAYEPVECRAEFRDNLLEKLKTKQRKKQELKRTTSKRIELFGAFAALAAAAAIIISAIPSINPDGAAESLAPVVGPTEVAVAPSPHVAKKPAGSKLVIRAMDNVELLKDGNWQKAEGLQNITLAQGEKVRVPADAVETALWVGESALLSMSPGSVIGNVDGEVEIIRGNAGIRVGDGGEVLAMRLPEYRLGIEPGTRMMVQMEDSSAYAENGAPAPHLAILVGKALAEGPSGKSVLQPEYSYDLFNTFVAGIPGKKMGEIKQRTYTNSSTSMMLAGSDRSRSRIRTGNRAEQWYVLGQSPEQEEQVKTFYGKKFVFGSRGWVDEVCDGNKACVELIFESPQYYQALARHPQIKDYIYHIGRMLVVKIDDTVYEIRPR